MLARNAMSRILAVVIVAALGGGASADPDKVDWSQYIDKNPSAPVKSTPVRIAEPKPAADKPAAKPAAKPKAKPKARAKSKPRHH